MYKNQRTEIVSQIQDGLLSVNDAKLSLAGWLLKHWEENITPVFGNDLSLSDNALQNVSDDIDMCLQGEK